MGVAVLVAAASAAGAVGGQSLAGAGSGTLRLGRATEFLTLDPGLEYTSEGWRLENATCARLYNYPDAPTPASLKAIPEVAKDFPTLSQHGRISTIVLRRSFRFHTGERITAASFVAAFNRDANPQFKDAEQKPSGAVGYMHEIVGADAVINGKATAISGVRALGAYTLQIRTTRRVPDLVFRLTMPFFCPVPAGTPPQEVVLPALPAGSGPYYISSHVPNQRVVLSRNPYYGGDRHPHVRQIVFNLGISGEACRIAVEQNKLDSCGVWAFPADDYRELGSRYGVNLKDGRFFVTPSSLATFYFAFNHDSRWFKGPGQIPLKQAINWAIDRHALAAEWGFRGAKPTDRILPPGLGLPAKIYPLGDRSEQDTAKRLATARALLAQAKRIPKTLVLYTGSFSTVVRDAYIFRYDLQRIGIDVDVRSFVNAELAKRAGTRYEPYDIYFAGWGADYPDPAGFLISQLDGRTIKNKGVTNTNYAYFNRPRYNRLIDAANRLQGSGRRAAWAKLDEDMMRKDPPWAPAFNRMSLDFISASFACFVRQAVTGIDLVAACKK